MKTMVCACLASMFLCASFAGAMTITIASSGVELVAVGEEWRFFRGTTDPSVPLDAWWKLDFDDGAWELGPTGIGYGDGDDATVIIGMQNSYLTIYTRKAFTLAEVPSGTVELEIDYDDGFVAYLNDAEIARRGIADDPVTRNSTAASHDAGTPELIALGRAADLLRAGANVLAIEIHNSSLGSTDLSLIPALRTRSGDVVKNGDRWVVGTPTVPLSGATSAAVAVAVTIDGVAAAFDAATGTWHGDAILDPGVNTVLVEARDAAAAVVDQGTITIVYVPPENHFAGALAADTVWSGACVVDADVTVPDGVTLTVEAGTEVMLAGAVVLTVNGRLLANGTEAAPIRFTHYGDGVAWKGIRLVGADDSRFAHCTFEYADCEGEHQDYYEPGTRDYHEAIVAVACNVEFDGCVFRNLPDERAGAEGDAIAVMSDDPDTPGAARAVVRNCRFLHIGQGVHERFSYVLIEGCFFTGKRGDNDDVDLWGESDPPPVVRRNLFLDPEHDDMVNPTKCSAIIEENILGGSDDHGLVLRDAGTPLVRNNVIFNCAAAGIAIENTCNALLVNNTIVNCGRGLRLFDLGREGPPYYLTPGGGTATVINCIIWDCPTSISLTDSANTAALDRGSHVTVRYSDIEGGLAGVSISGTFSTVTWGDGNIDADPLFVDAAQRDFHLQAASPVIDAGTVEEAPAIDVEGNVRPCGAAVDMGAYEVCEEQPVRFRRGDPNADGRMDLSDVVSVLRHLFGGGRAPSCAKSADANDDGTLDIADAVAMLAYLFSGGNVLPQPFTACGADATIDALDCAAYAPCE